MDSLLKEESVILPWDRFGRWIRCICVVTFDLELGQAMELVYPKHIKLSDSEKMNISYLAFPDSNSGCMGDTQYHFRIRMSTSKRQFPQKNDEFSDYCPSYLMPSIGHSFGYVYFRQVRDKSIRRGYFQKSVVIISPLPFIPLFTQVVSIIAPEFFNNGPTSLEVACHDVDQWPVPECGPPLNLPIMGSVIQVQIPSKGDRLVMTEPSASSTISVVNHQPMMNPATLTFLSSAYEVNLFTALLAILPHLQLIWELVITSQPLLVMAPSPTLCSEVVQALVSCIFPVRYATDYRPFFTIHDSEFKEFTTKTQAAPQVILGVTNPFFGKALLHWPNIIRIGECVSVGSKELKKMKSNSSNFKSEEAKPGVYTRHKPFLNKDPTLCKRIKKVTSDDSEGSQGGRPAQIQTQMIRRFCLELTQSFMIPLESYIASLMPLRKNISPFKGVPSLGRFNMENFFKSIESSGPQLTCGIKGDWVGLYKKFFSSANFAAWLSHRQWEINLKLEQLHVESLCAADLDSWVAGKQEVELVDMIIHVNGKLQLGKNREIQLTKEQTARLRQQIDTVMSALPEDLRGVVQQSSSGCGAAVSVVS